VEPLDAAAWARIAAVAVSVVVVVELEKMVRRAWARHGEPSGARQ